VIAAADADAELRRVLGIAFSSSSRPRVAPFGVTRHRGASAIAGRRAGCAFSRTTFRMDRGALAPPVFPHRTTAGCPPGAGEGLRYNSDLLI
jgi:hypothetical protein